MRSQIKTGNNARLTILAPINGCAGSLRKTFCFCGMNPPGSIRMARVRTIGRNMRPISRIMATWAAFTRNTNLAWKATRPRFFISCRRDSTTRTFPLRPAGAATFNGAKGPDNETFAYVNHQGAANSISTKYSQVFLSGDLQQFCGPHGLGQRRQGKPKSDCGHQ